MLGVFIGLGVIVFLLLIFILPGIFSVGANEVGILTRKMTGEKLPAGRVVARDGENGLQAGTLMPGLYWKFWIFWSWSKVKVTVIPSGNIGVIESIDGQPLPPHRILGDSKDSNSFQDAKLFFTNEGYRGIQVDILRPGTYRINTKVFHIELKPAVFVDKNKIGVAIAADGKGLPNGYIVAPEPDDVNAHDHKHFQDGQQFITGGGYRGPQLETLQPGEYYINPALFQVTIYDVVEVPTGYVAILRSNVGKEVAKAHVSPDGKESTGASKDIENILIQNRDERGIWVTPVIPGKYNMNPIAFSPYLVPTSAVTIDWASEGKIGTEIKKTASEKDDTNEGVLFKFNPLRVTSMDGFQLDVNVRMVIRIKPEDAAFIIARFGSVDNLIDQIVHPLIDSAFRNKAGEKKAIVFFQSRTELQAEALEHARTTFGEYRVEAQNLLVAYIDIPQELLDTQTMKEIALQQQTQYKEQAKAQEENIAVQEKTARSEKQKDVIAAKLQIGINEDLASAAVKKAEGEKTSRILVAEGEASYILQTGNAEGAKQKAIGEGKAAGYEAQVKAMGQDNTALVNVVNNLGDNKTKIVPEILITSGGGEGGISNLVNVLLAKNTKDLVAPKSEEKK